MTSERSTSESQPQWTLEETREFFETLGRRRNREADGSQSASRVEPKTPLPEPLSRTEGLELD